MAADPLDVLTATEAKDAINHPTIAGAALGELEQMVTGISRSMDLLCGPVVAREVVERHSRRSGPIRLTTTPVVGVTAVSEWAGGVETPLVMDDWYLDAKNHRALLWRRVNGVNTAWRAGEVEVTYLAGRYANTASVDRLFKMAAASALRVTWQQEAPRWAQRPDFPADIEDVIGFVSPDELIRRRLKRELLPPAFA